MDVQKKNYSNFAELKEACVNFVQASKGRGAFTGLKKLLTELYPDKAHFVYELLQNAEDQKATEVQFILYNDRLIFRHNGEGDFALSDIDSITNIGNSTKIDDPTTIGQFGVGFKAVYAYTNTPEIHSGEYDFKILDMLIPENKDVEKRACNGITEFIFPFDNPNKPPETAVVEIENTLKALDETSILFLQHIKCIRFTLPSHEEGRISFCSSVSDIKFIKAIDIEFKGLKNRTLWAKFVCNAAIDNNGERKRYPVSIAYKLFIDDEGKYLVDSKLIGKVCIYFPTDQNSLLHFHINAPFASTVARDNIQYCAENEQLLDYLADLLISSIYDFKKYKMLDYSVYEALPLQRDFDSQSRYKIFYDKIYNEFENASLFIDENGEYKRKEEILIASGDMKKVLPQKYVKQYYSKNWIPAIQPTQRIEYFIRQFNINSYTMENFFSDLNKDANFFDALFSENANVEYMRNLYYMLSQPLKSFNNNINIKETLNGVKFMLCKDGMLHSISERVYLETDYKPTYIRDPIYIDLGKGNVDRTEQLKDFFKKLGVQDMSLQVDSMSEIENTNDKDDIVLKLLEIIEYYKNDGDVKKFLESAFILGRCVSDGHVRRVKAFECCWDETVYFFYEHENKDDCKGIKYIVATDYYQSLNSNEWEVFKEIFIRLNGKTKPEIYKCYDIYNHPEYHTLNTSRERYDTMDCSDYTITGLSELKRIPKEKLYNEALLLWKVIVRDKNVKHNEAFYKPNQSAFAQELESRIAWNLKRIAWIPTRAGEFKRPCDISEGELCDDYECPSSDSVFLNSIGFGDPSKAPDNLINNLESAGIKISDVVKELLGATDEEKEAMANFLKTRRSRIKEEKSLSDALSDENKDQHDFEDDDDYGVERGIKNPQGRAERQQKEFEQGLENKIERKIGLTYTYSTKTTNIEKQFIRTQYKGVCQICGRKPIIKYNGDIYFESINIISTANLDSRLLNNIDAGWNTLCLCPTCAAEYRYCAKSLDKFEDQVENTFVEPNKNDYISIQIQLKGSPTDIKFTPRHFIALKSAFKVYKENEIKDKK